MATKKVTITIDPEKLDEFYRIAAKNGIKFSTSVRDKVDEFIEEKGRVNHIPIVIDSPDLLFYIYTNFLFQGIGIWEH